MSFGFALSDFLAVAKIARSIYKSCKAGPVEYQELCSETKSLGYALQSLSHDVREPDSLLNRKGLQRKGQLDDIISSCKSTMKDLQTMIDKRSNLQPDRNGKITRTWDAYKVGSSDLDSYRGKLTFHTSTISVFLLSLQGPAMKRIETRLDKIYARMIQDDMAQARQSTVSLVSTASILSQIDTHEDDVFAILKTELLAEDISLARIIGHKDDIISHVKKLLNSGTKGDADDVKEAGLLCHQNSVLSLPTDNTTLEGSVPKRYKELEASHRASQEIKAKLESRAIEAENAYNLKLTSIECDHHSAVTYVNKTKKMLKRVESELTQAKQRLESQEQELRESMRENNQMKAKMFPAIEDTQSTEKSDQLVVAQIRAPYEMQQQETHQADRETTQEIKKKYLGALAKARGVEKKLIVELTEAKRRNQRLEVELDQRLEGAPSTGGLVNKVFAKLAPMVVDSEENYRMRFRVLGIGEVEL